ncbi:FadR/GntR family transcriptional regulator [Actinacidiphila epipremni]|uniref:FadR family transcriptional regulator n=1 Tax=Actinacidiphila epipremni TaxID=2053013 RepID=A0ABX0ZSY4_9ACTN|nr:FCD domain-containing protein [Actinacidiphila epipremni]NJP45907.1 FadR family transcriptional regulator [Actinacidiphila epipremni]
MALGSLRPGPLVEQATEHLREQIVAGRWPVGTRLPGETALAASLGVGRSTVREAVRALAGAGLVTSRQGAGVFVVRTRPDEDFGTRLRRAAVTDVYEARAVVEVQAARLAARRRTAADLAGLESALTARREAAGRGGAALVDADLALHAGVVAAARNPVLTDLFAEFAPALRAALIGLAALPGPDGSGRAPVDGDASHIALVAAVAARDGDEAARLLEAEFAAPPARPRG